MVNDTCADWPTLAGTRRAAEVARQRRTGPQVQLSDVTSGSRAVLGTVAGTCSSCVPFTLAELICRLLNENVVYDSPKPDGNGGVRLSASYTR
jgi:hypothetical protein